MSAARRVVVNRSFASQRVTGQQRYAHEISDRLVGRAGVRALEPTGWWNGSAVRVWLWALGLLPLRARGRVLLSLTARAPLWARKHVLVVHDLFVLTNPEWFSRTYVWTHAPLLRLQLRAASALIAVSQPVAEQLTGYGVPVTVAPNAPSTVFSVTATDKDDSVLEARGLRRGTYLLAVGSLDPRKNLPLLARAYAALTPEERAAHPLVLVGGGASIYRSQDLDWSPEVVNAGYVSDAELRALYGGARAVVFVSLAEGFGLPLVEAAAAGAGSLVISDIDVFRWVCGEAAHYVDPTSVASITAGLRHSFEVARPPGIDVNRFDWDDSARRVRDLCEAVAAGVGEQVSVVDSRDPTFVSCSGSEDGPVLVEDVAIPVPSVAVVLASAGRPNLLAQALRWCNAQAGQRFTGVVSVPDAASLPDDPDALQGWTVVTGTRGLAAQRNAGMDAVPDADLVAFFDDDAVVREDYLANAVDFFARHPGVVGLTGQVLADGAVSGEIDEADAEKLVEASRDAQATEAWRRTRELYGCNFVVRTSPGSRLRFDGRLPLYSWLEDHDYARRLMRRGLLAHVDGCVIVHRAAASGGRQAHTRLGYSQVMNPVYLMTKGSFPLWLVAHEIVFRGAKNVVLSAHGPSAAWRRERLRGNLLGVADVVRGRITPERAAEL